MFRFSGSQRLPLLIAAFLMVGTAPVCAAVLTLNLGNDDLDAFSPPYGTVEVVLLSGGMEAQVTATAASNDTYHYLFGNNGTLGLNTNGEASIKDGLDGIVATVPSQAGFEGPWITRLETGGQRLSEWGSFNFVLKSLGGFKNSLLSLTFTLQKTSGTWSSDQDVLTPNANGRLAAAHVFVANTDWTNTGDTGFATCNVANPEPSGLLVWLLGGVTLAGLRRRKQLA